LIDYPEISERLITLDRLKVQGSSQKKKKKRKKKKKKLHKEKKKEIEKPFWTPSEQDSGAPHIDFLMLLHLSLKK
jgi:hypothetical protein